LVPLHELGRLEVERSTNIEFNNTNQAVGGKAFERQGSVLCKVRLACLEWEQTKLQPE